MTYLEKYSELNKQVSSELKKLVEEKGYDETKLWESEDDSRYDIPTELYLDDGFYTRYTLVKWEDGSFTGRSWDTNNEFFFDIEDLDLFTKCELIDWINES